MKFRKAVKQDITSIATIFDEARNFMHSQGSDQWRPDYPTAANALADINNDVAYVIEDNGIIAAYCAVIFTGEPAYDQETCHWFTGGRYAVIHRIAVGERYRGQGLSKWLVKRVLGLCADRGVQSLRIDTRDDNIRMTAMMLNMGFKTCGYCIYPVAGRREVFEYYDF